ncbi:hypothetical protein BBJ28_00003783, partial [Nothophytophthora sp. Chile5]
SLTEEQRALFVHGGQLDDYEVLKPIGKGKFSVVYKAKRRHDGQAVALKKIAIFDMMNAKAREKTLKEVRLVQSVSHPNIVQYLDAFIQNNELYIAFEWAEAGDLKRQIRKANEKGVRFDERTIWRYFTQLCAAILYLHQERIMHRDLKPANIFLTLQGVVKVGDLGLGRHLSENTMEAHSKVGTPLYMSPEVLRGEGYDWKSDVWSMGCILYELAMLRSPFKSEGLNLAGLFQKINKGDYQAVHEVYSEHLRILVTRMISLKAGDRPSVEEVWDLCRKRPSSAALQEMRLRHQASVENNSTADKDSGKMTGRSRNAKARASPEEGNPSRPTSAEQQQETPPSSRPSSSQKSSSSGPGEEEVKRRHAEMRMDLLFEKLKLLRYESVLKKRISGKHFVSESRQLPTMMPQSRFSDVLALSQWLLSLLSIDIEENVDRKHDSPIVIAQKLLLAAERAGVTEVAQLSAPLLTSGVGLEVCLLLDALSTRALSVGGLCSAPPVYPHEPIENMEPLDVLDVTDDDGEQSGGSGGGAGDSTTSCPFADEDDDMFARWLVVKEEHGDAALAANRDREDGMIHSSIDPKAWDLERRRMLPKLQALLQDKQRRHSDEASWRMRLDQMRIHGELLQTKQGNTCREIMQAGEVHSAVHCCN